MRSWPAPPPGFVLAPADARALYVDAALAADPAARSLATWDGWRAAVAAPAEGSGRGGTAIVGGARGARWRLKLMRRGGLLAPLWRERYPSPGRLVSTLGASVEARERGIPTPRPIALLVESGVAGLTRGALAVEEIPATEDLARLAQRGAVDEDDLAAAMSVVRAMHDRGMIHPDLNLGNILLRGAGSGRPEAFVIDLDGVRFTDGPVGFGARQAAVRRMERSCAKLTGDAGPLGPGSRDLWYRLYASGDVAMAVRLEKGRVAGRLSLAVHRAGWRRPS